MSCSTSLSRAYCKDETDNSLDEEVELHVCSIIAEINITENKLSEFKIKTAEDSTL